MLRGLGFNREYFVSNYFAKKKKREPRIIVALLIWYVGTYLGYAYLGRYRIYLIRNFTMRESVYRCSALDFFFYIPTYELRYTYKQYPYFFFSNFQLNL